VSQSISHAFAALKSSSTTSTAVSGPAADRTWRLSPGPRGVRPRITRVQSAIQARKRSAWMRFRRRPAAQARLGCCRSRESGFSVCCR
jgi:hypothetical protein